MTNPVVVANRPNVSPETSPLAEDAMAMMEVVASACLAAPATIRRLLELARSTNLRVARAACGDLLQVRSLPDDMRWEVLRLLATQELKARAQRSARQRARSEGRGTRRK